jgi:hypothetical protein
MSLYNDYEAFNRDVKRWSGSTRRAMMGHLNREKVHATGKLKRNLRYFTKQFYGITETISFRFPRYGVYVEKGVGRGWPISRAQSSGGLGKRKAKPWFNPVLDKAVPDLADRLQKHAADIVSDNMRIK